MILKAFDSHHRDSYDAIVDAIYFAIHWKGSNNEKVSIINLSLGSFKKNSKLKKAIKHATLNKILIVGSTGNFKSNKNKGNSLMYPSRYPEVIKVGALDQSFNIAPFSSSDKKINFLAPGVNILSTIPNNKYAYFSGTSMAAPHVTGILALILKVYSINEILILLEKSLLHYTLPAIHTSVFIKN